MHLPRKNARSKSSLLTSMKLFVDRMFRVACHVRFLNYQDITWFFACTTEHACLIHSFFLKVFGLKTCSGIHRHREVT